MTDTDLMIYEDETPPALVQWANAPKQAWGLADALMGMHPAAREVGIEGMRTVAQLAMLTGANPLPGTNGIHVWRDKEGRICHAFGVGFWRGEADRAGGLLWLITPRAMTEEERKAHAVAPGIPAAICSAALRAEVFSLRAQARQFGDELTFEEAKAAVARTGIGIGVANEYPKKGRPAIWAALMRAERDLLRQLVSIGTNGAPPPVRRDWSPRQLGDMSGHVPLVGADGGRYTMADANADLFGDDSPPRARRVAEVEDGVIEDAAPQEQPPTPPPPPAATGNGGNGQQQDAGPLPDDELTIDEAPARDFINVAAGLLDADADTVKARMKALGYGSVPGKPADRVAAYRALKADLGTNEQPALFGNETEPAPAGQEYRD